MNRIVVINPTEPAPLSIRHPQGLDLQLQVELRDVSDVAVDPDTVLPVLTLRPRSGGAEQSYDMPTYDAGNGIASVLIDGASLRDPHGYSIELYSSDGDGERLDLIAAGKLAIRVTTYGYSGGPAWV